MSATLPNEVFTSLTAGAGVAVFAGAHFGADALAAVHAVREAGGVLAAVAVVAALTTTFSALSHNFYSFRASFSHKTKLVTSPPRYGLSSS